MSFYNPYRWCVALNCKNSTLKTPEKLFITIPNDVSVRYVWLELAGQDPTKYSEKSHLYICEDHFDLQQDMENYMQYKLMGSVKKIRMKLNSVPSKFSHIPIASASKEVESTAASVPPALATPFLEEGQEVLPSTSYQADSVNPNQTAESTLFTSYVMEKLEKTDKEVQVHIVPTMKYKSVQTLPVHYRSRATQINFKDTWSKKQKHISELKCQGVSPIEFSVQVEVEEFHEGLNSDDADNGLEPINKEANEEKDKPENVTFIRPKLEITSETIQTSNSDKYKSNNLASDKVVKAADKASDKPESKDSTVQYGDLSLLKQISQYNRSAESILQCKVDEDDILSAITEITKSTTNVADQIIDVGARNSWGVIRQVPSTLTTIVKRLDNALNEWKKWKSTSCLRNTPLLYKCYVCQLAWWHYEPFRVHMNEHTNEEIEILVDTEINHHECNIIAYSGLKPVMFDIPVESNCWHCIKPYEYHMISKRQSGVFYNCEYCSARFYTCIAAQEHEGVCLARRKKLCAELPLGTVVDIFKCSMCRVIFFSKAALKEHFVNYHIVRSDLPVVNSVRVCPICKQCLVIPSYHKCKKKKACINCPHCNRKFMNKHLEFLHKTYNERNHRCIVCDATLPWKCMEVEHMLTHTSNYLMLYKCGSCTENILFLNKTSIKQHKMFRHKLKHEIGTDFFYSVIVPKQCIDSAKVEQMDIVTSLGGKLEILAKSNKDGVLEVCNIEKGKGKKKQAKKKSGQETAEEPVAAGDIAEPETASNENHVTIKTEKEYTDNEMEELNDTESITIKDEPIVRPVPQPTRMSYEDLLCKVFNVSRSEIETHCFNEDNKVTVKEEEDEMCEDDIIILNQTYQNDVTLMSDGDKESNIVSTPSTPERATPEPSTSFSNRAVYKCVSCDRAEKSYTSLKNHMLKCPMGYKCNKCDISFSVLNNYLRHYTCHGVDELNCLMCGITFKYAVPLVNHLKSHVWTLFRNEKFKGRSVEEGGARRFACKQCDQEIKSETLFSHWDSHLQWDGDVLIQKHPREAPEPKEDERPPDCKLADDMVQQLISVIRTSFWKNKAMLWKKCLVCDMKFDRRNAYKRHLIEHLLSDAMARHNSSGGFTCQICDDTFTKPSPYRQHMRAHALLPMYQCKMCPKQFSDSSNYAKHKKMHTNNLFECSLCAKKFHTAVTMQRHLEVHRNTEPVVCECCKQTFYSTSAYKRHVKYRQNRVLYSCIYCKMKFKNTRDISDHKWTVHKVRKYEADCPICGLSFRKYQDVRLHFLREHSDNMHLLKLVHREVKRGKKPNILRRDGSDVEDDTNSQDSST